MAQNPNPKKSLTEKIEEFEDNHEKTSRAINHSLGSILPASSTIINAINYLEKHTGRVTNGDGELQYEFTEGALINPNEAFCLGLDLGNSILGGAGYHLSGGLSNYKKTMGIRAGITATNIAKLITDLLVKPLEAINHYFASGTYDLNEHVQDFTPSIILKTIYAGIQGAILIYTLYSQFRDTTITVNKAGYSVNDLSGIVNKMGENVVKTADALKREINALKQKKP